MDGLKPSRLTDAVVVLSDVHLSTNVQPQRESAVCEVLARHPGRDVVFLGDLFEFSSVGTADPAEALAHLVRANPRFISALRRHAAAARVFLVAGNHDAELANLGEQVSNYCGNNVTVVPWCLRLGSVHLEHGHVFDRDNAPIHPLAPHSPKHESLGAALMRRVVVNLDARVFAHAHSLTPRRALVAGCKTLGWRLPLVLCRVVSVVANLVVRAAWDRWGAGAALRRKGAQRVAEAAKRAGISVTALETLLAWAPKPTHSGFLRMGFRLYLDWALAALVAICCAFVFFAGAPLAVWGVALSLGYLWASSSDRGVASRWFDARRYEPPLEALLAGATSVVKLTSASRVVLGHTHVEYDDGQYFNLGSFGYGGGAGRPYAVVTPNGQVTRCFVAFDCGQ